MLNSVTKKKIDNARDILVGKIPMPTTQVEQITLALIYKFMADMDKRAKALGDTSGFFANGYEQYAWDHLMDKSLSARDRVKLYSDGLEKMSTNPHIPQLFRDIFRNAFLPFKDPETLKLFLDQINQFSYDNSEELGNAFEYLLSVMSSQGDAGQFRTPRHIIDFIVEVVEPTVNDRILDPACGTAGFLISAFKYLQKKGLPAEELKKVTDHVVGYDISHDMVRLSLVNLYLHQFPNPHIYEYDTLTSEDRWQDQFDCILANPPFMTPKGGIRPHSRFSIPSNRAEVLFVDYIMEHLSIDGRAGIIVPEGIIFQSQNAYKNLRKMMVDENFLWAVVSLPAGIFQPYSGVKTSILLFDKKIAKKINHVLFVKVENDGFNLGAQRKLVIGDELPMAKEALVEYRKHVLSDGVLSDTGWPAIAAVDTNPLCSFVSKKDLARDENYGLDINRYKKANFQGLISHQMVELGDVVVLETGSRDKGGALSNGIPSIGGEQISSHGSIRTEKMKYISEDFFRNMKKGILSKNDVLLVKDGATTGKTCFYTGNYEKAAINEHVYILRAKEEIIPFFLYHIIRSTIFQNTLKTYVKGIIGGISSEIKKITIPLPTISFQQKVVDDLVKYQKIIDGARQIIENYSPVFEIKPDWPVYSLKELIQDKPKNGYSGQPVSYQTKTKVLSMSATSSGVLDKSKFKYLDEEISPSSTARCKKGDILLQRGNTRELVGIPAIFDIDDSDYIFPDLMIKIRAKEDLILTDFLYFVLVSPEIRKFVKESATGSAGSMPKINQSIVESIPIPTPSLEIQRSIVENLINEKNLIKKNEETINIFEDKINSKIAAIYSEQII